MSMIVKFWGTRGSIPVPGWSTQIYGGNTPCVEVRLDDTVFICDAGTGIRLLSEDLKTRAATSIHLFLTHFHPAHVQGLAFFEQLHSRELPITLYTSSSHQQRLEETASQCGISATATFHRQTLPARSEIQGVNIRSFAVNHSGECVGLSFEQNGDKVVYIPDIELPIHQGETFPDLKHESLLMRKVGHELVEFIRGANLLIIDGQYSEEEYASNRGRGHSSCVSATDLALQAGVHQLALFHHDPKSTDLDLEEKARFCNDRVAKFGAELTVFPARERMALRL